MSDSDHPRKIWDKIRGTPARIPSRVNIARDHVDEGDELETAIQKDKHYFQIRINEMYLAYERQWFKKYDPMVLVISEFIYGREQVAIPSVVGPAMMKKFGQFMPKGGMVFSDTQVTGPHPYKGGSLNLTVVLCQLTVANYLQDFLRIVESTANILDFSKAFSTSLKLATVVLDGIETILGSQLTHPLIGLRKDYAVTLLEPGYFALVDIDKNDLNEEKLWVRNRQLVHGESLADATPFRKADYVLYSVLPTLPPDRRGDIPVLPFYSHWTNVVEEASRPTPNDWKRAKEHMAILYRSMMLSPDLVEDEADTQFSLWQTEAEKKHKKAALMSDMGPSGVKTPSESDKIRKKMVEILEL